MNVVGNESFDWNSSDCLTSLSTNKGHSFYYQGKGSGPSHFYMASNWRSGSSKGKLKGMTSIYFNSAQCTPVNGSATFSHLEYYKLGTADITVIAGLNGPIAAPVYCVAE